MISVTEMSLGIAVVEAGMRSRSGFEEVLAASSGSCSVLPVSCCLLGAGNVCNVIARLGLSWLIACNQTTRSGQ